MKILTKEEEQEHYQWVISSQFRKDDTLICRRTTLKGGIVGGLAGLAFGAVGVYAAGARYPAFRQLTLPLRAFLMTSTGTFSGMKTFSFVLENQRNENSNTREEKAKAGLGIAVKFLKRTAT